MCLYRACIGMSVYVYKHMLGCECAHSLVYVGLSGYVCEYMCACVCTFMCMCTCVHMYSSQKTDVIPVDKWNRTNKVCVERT